MTKILDDVRDYGYHTFENGNQIPAYIWTKMVDARAEYGYRLTTQCPVGKEDDPVLYPSWRGQHNDWGSLYPAFAGVTQTNVAIKGLFKKVSATEEAELLADGYTKVDWGATLLANRDEYETNLFLNFDSSKAPIYLFPFTPNTMATGGFTNGYGFANN
jgi:hypothetical protein